MSMEELKIVYNYFNNIIGRKRVGAYVTEMRRQLAISLDKDGATTSQITDILCIDRTSTYHYLGKCKMPTDKVFNEVKDNMMDWISNGLIPKNCQSNNKSYLTFVESADEKPRRVPIQRRKKTNQYDEYLKQIKEIIAD